MRKFPFLEQAGLRVAAISDLSDGDCARNATNPEACRDFLQRCDAPPQQLARVKQVHGVTILSVDSPADVEDAPEADGLITCNPDVVLGISVADCVPLWLYDPCNSAVALLHAGREGTVAGIARLGVSAMVAQFCSRPEHLLAVIGPSAGPCCYEVSPEMAADLEKQGVAMRGRNVDLWGENTRQLLESGVVTAHVHAAAECTICGPGYHSFRREGGRARNLAVARL